MPDEDQNIDDWLEEWVEENINCPGYHEHKETMSLEANACLEQAKADGFSAADVKAAAGGDLLAYLMRQQNGLTDAHIKRQADKDP